MIIPPDPEKDPNAFSASASTTSLVPPPSDSDSDSLQPPQPARTRNGAFGYPYGDDLGVGYNGEALPPYQRERLEGGNLFADPPVMRERVNRFSVTQPSITIPTTAIRTEPQVAPSPLSPDDELTPIASTSTTRLPFTVVPISGAPASTSKLWESSSTTSTGNVSNSRFLVPAPSVRRWWKKWRKWVYIAIGLLLAGLGLMIGMLVGVGTGEHEDQSKDMAAWKDVSGDGQRANWVTSGESLNITYIPSRDGPQGNEGNLTTCPIFYPLNSSDPVHLLATPFPAQKLSYATFQFPLAKNGTDPQVLADFTMFARGLGSSGTVEIIGAEAPREVINAGREGFVSIDVVAMYSGKQDLNNLIKVCELARENNSLGLGIFTPKETDGKVSNAYMLNPADLPSFHVVVRLPPSALLAPETANIVIPRMTFELDRMAVRLGNLHNVVDFGDLSIDSIRGGVTVGYAAAETISIRTGENAVRGRFNISESISVNCTEGTILAELILFDPESNAHTVVFDPPSALYKRDQLEARGPFDASTSSDNDTIPAEPVKKRISTSFVTGDGLLDISYVYQAPTVILSAFIATGEGEVSVALHPNYVGPFVALNGWGQIRLPQPKELYDIDPLGLGRRRQVSIGPFDPDENGLFARKQLNATSLKTSMAVSGAAYWAPNGNTSTPQEVVDEDAVDGSEGSEVLILGAWGDVRLTADAT